MTMKFSNIEIALEEGRLKIPQFQRNFVWTLEESAALLDSVIKEYPIGSIILWNTAETLRAVKNIGGLEFKKAKEGRHVDYIIDGQQRITSLYAILKGVEEIDRDGKKTSYTNVYVDLETQDDEKIVVLEKEEQTPENSERYIRLHELLEDNSEFIITYPKDKQNKIKSYRDKIVGFILPTINLPENASIEVATEVFTRLNTRGKSLGPFEIMVAKTYDEKRGFDLSEKYKELCEELGDWEVPDTTVLQIAATLLTQYCSKKIILSLKKDDFIDIWDEVVDCIKTAIEFFKTNYRIPVSKILPYDGLLVVFAYYFSKTNQEIPDGKEADYLRELFWSVSIAERYKEGLEAKINKDVKRVDNIIKGVRDKPDWFVDTAVERIKNNGEFSVGRSFIKTILAVYAAKLPQNFRHGGLVILDNSYLKRANSKNYHHFFPKDFLKNNTISDLPINHILNITIIDEKLNKKDIWKHPPSKYLTEFNQVNSKLKEHLKTHLIDLDKDGVLNDEYDTFFNNRAKRISEELKELIKVDGD